MNNKRGLVAPLLAIGILAIGLFIVLFTFGPEIKNMGFLSLKKAKEESQAAGKISEFKIKNNSNVASPKPISSSPSPIIDATAPSPGASPSLTLSTIYSQPQGKYSLVLPSGWRVAETSATKTYSTTRFNGPSGSISITFGSGKDPIGGCSETTSVILADRTIAACFILQKDGSQIMTRGYTKDKTGIDFTIEATFNYPASASSQEVLNVIKSINIE